MIDGRPQLAQDIDQVDAKLGRYFAAGIKALFEDRNFLTALPAHLPGDAASQACLPELIRRLRAIGNMSQK